LVKNKKLSISAVGTLVLLNTIFSLPSYADNADPCTSTDYAISGQNVYIVCQQGGGGGGQELPDRAMSGGGAGKEAPPPSSEQINQGNAKEVSYHTIIDTEKNKVAVADDGSGSCINNGKPGRMVNNLPLPANGEAEDHGAIRAGRGAKACVPYDDQKPADQPDLKGEPTQEQVDARVREELRSMKISKPVLHIDDGPNVLYKQNINYYVTDADTQSKKADIFGKEATIQVVPVNFIYNYGNGETYTTNTAGAAGAYWNSERDDYEETPTSHKFVESGNFHSYVTVVYQARYRFGEGAWRPIGQTQLQSDSMLIRLWEVEVHNVAKTCNEDPYAWGCPMHKDYPDYTNPNPKLTKPDPVTGQRWHKDDVGNGDTEGRKRAKS